MKTLLISFVIWVLIVPVVAAVFLIFTSMAAFVQDLYFAGTLLALAFAVLTMVWGPFWLGPFSGSSSQRSERDSNSTEEKKRAHSSKGHLRS